MMIRINLLPVRQVKKRELGRQFLVLSVGVLIVALGGNYLWWNSREAEFTRRATQANDTTRRIAELEKVIGEVNNINKRKKEVQEKLSVLDNLRKQRSGPVRMLDALATSIPSKVWLADFTEAASAVKITGLAESHEDVSEFMKSLTNVVWTPKGMARVVEKKRDATAARVELLTGENSMEDFPLTDIANFFNNVELKTSESSSAGVSRSGGKLVRWEISMSANYAI